MFHSARHLTWTTYVIGGIILILGLLAAVLAGTMVVRSLRRLTREVERIQAGNLDEVVTPPLLQDEIGTLARAIEDMRLTLKRELERRDTRVSVASHELRTPMTTIMGSANCSCVDRCPRPPSGSGWSTSTETARGLPPSWTMC